MSEVRKGTVQFANKNTRFDPNKPLYSIKLQGSNEYLNFGEKDPSLEPGDVVTITGTVTNGKFRAEPKDVVKEGKAEVTPTTKRSFGGGKGNQVKEQYWELKQKMDLEMQPEYRYRSCVANAISFMKLLEDSNCLPITEANQSKPAKKFDAMLKLRKQLTIMLYDEMVAESKALNAKHLAIGDSSEKPEEFGCVETSTDEDTSEES